MEEIPDISLKMTHVAEHNGQKHMKMPVLTSLLNTSLKIEVASGGISQLMDPMTDFAIPQHENQDIKDGAKPQHSNLRKHMKIHAKYEAYIGNKESPESGKLHQHTLTHTAVLKPYKCPICHITFTQSGTLKQHITLIHSTVIPDNSSWCDDRSLQIDTHMTTHDGVKNSLIPSDKSYSQVIDQGFDAGIYQDVHRDVLGSPNMSVNSDKIYSTEHPVISGLLNSVPPPDTSLNRNECRVFNTTSAEPPHISQYVRRKLKESLISSSRRRTNVVPTEHEPKNQYTKQKLKESVGKRTGVNPKEAEIKDQNHLMSPSQTAPAQKGFSPTVDSAETTHQDVTSSAEPQLVDEYPALRGQLQGHMMFQAKTPEDNNPKVPFITTPHIMKPDGNQHIDTDCEEKPAEEPHKCSECGKRFNQLKNLRLHMMSHAGKRPYNCPVCYKSFNRATDIREHMVVHTGKKPYQCSVCKNRFTQQRSLLQHMLIHKEIKPHRCFVCDQAFTQITHLHKHMMLHKGEKPYKCFMCDAPYNQSRTLYRHIRKMHPTEVPHKSSVFSEASKEPSQLDRHIDKCTRMSDTTDKPHTTHSTTESPVDADISQNVDAQVCYPCDKNLHMTIHTKVRAEKSLDAAESASVGSVMSEGLASTVDVLMSKNGKGKGNVDSAVVEEFSQEEQYMTVHKNLDYHRSLVAGNERQTTRERIDFLIDVVMFENQGVPKLQDSSQCGTESPDLDYLKEHLVNIEESSSSSLVEEPQTMALKSENASWDVSPKPHHSFVDKVPDISYLNEHLVKTEQLFPTPKLNIARNAFQDVNATTKSLQLVDRFQRISNTNKHLNNNVQNEYHSSYHSKVDTQELATQTITHRVETAGNIGCPSNNTHTDEKPHRCPVCSFRFRNISVFQQHLLLHQTGVLKAAPQEKGCVIQPSDPKEHKVLTGFYHSSQDASSLSELQEHRKPRTFQSSQELCYTREPNVNNVPKVSTQSSQDLLSPSELNGHKVKKTYNCTVCNKENKSLWYLKQHLKTHQMHKCPVCNKEVIYPSYLKGHMLTHSADRPYKCSVCKSSFRLRTALKPHECHSCSQCLQGFADHLELTAHMVTHTEDHCDVMGCRKETSPQLQRYVWSKSHGCYLCIKGFTHAHQLTAHIMSHRD